MVLHSDGTGLGRVACSAFVVGFVVAVDDADPILDCETLVAVVVAVAFVDNTADTGSFVVVAVVGRIVLGGDLVSSVHDSRFRSDQEGSCQSFGRSEEELKCR